MNAALDEYGIIALACRTKHVGDQGVAYRQYRLLCRVARQPKRMTIDAG